ncbi:MAG: methyltransferase [Candidatus Kerfeldbacteria bacterium]
MKKNTLTEKNLTLMDDIQKEIVLTQWQKHQHETYEIDFNVSGEGDVINRFIVGEGVWDPFLASGRYHARYLFYNNHLFYGKTAIEMGCGTGLMDIVMAKYGAKKVIASDISLLACQNTIDNAIKFGLEENIHVVQGDLFENISEIVDMILWNIPFFPGTPPKGDTIAASMIIPPELFERFLIDSKKYLKSGGVVVIPSYSLGGEFNDPMSVAPKFGYDVKRKWTHNSLNGIQQGLLYIDELRLK